MTTNGDSLGELVTHLSRAMRGAVRHQGLAPHQFRALRTIAPSPVRPARLAERLDITPRAVTDVVDALTERALVEVRQDPADRRAKLVSITAAGKAALGEVRAERAAAAERLFGVLDDEERATLARLLQRVVDGA